jgi:hypothetical protein
MRTIAILAATAAGALLSAGALHADGGPSPGVVQGLNGVVAPAKGIRYVALGSRSTTMVAAVRVRGGHVLRFNTVAGNLGVPIVAYDGTAGGVTPDGRRLVLASVVPGLTSRFAVLDTASLRVRSRIALRGVFAFDAASPDARTLYLIQFLSGGTRYRVRAYDVARGRLVAEPVVAKGDDTSPMRGSPVARRMGPGGRWAFTLYRGGKEPFVHALDTVARRAVCIDLPRPGAKLELRGRRLIVLNQVHAPVASIDTRTMRRIGSPHE